MKEMTRPCEECIVDMICVKECPRFKVNMKRLQSDEEVYLKRCMNNIESETYKISENVGVDISFTFIRWFKDGVYHRDNDQPAIIWADGTRHWYKYGLYHRDNKQPAIIYSDGSKIWYKNGVQYKTYDPI